MAIKTYEILALFRSIFYLIQVCNNYFILFQVCFQKIGQRRAMLIIDIPCSKGKVDNDNVYSSNKTSKTNDTSTLIMIKFFVLLLLY